MEYRSLGNTGLKVSVLGYGAWVSFSYQLGVEAAKALIARCWEAGVNFFDNAEVYANGEAERIMGQALKELGYKREEYVLSTKVCFGAGSDKPTAKGLSRKHIVEGTRACLERLGADHVDVVFAHRPDPSVPMEEVVRAFNHVIDRGWAFYWGTSEWSAEQIQEAWEVAERLGLIGPAVEQPQYNLFCRQRVEEEYAPLYERWGTGLTIFSPLCSGLLTGKYSGGAVPPDSRMALERYAFLAERSQVAQRHATVDKLTPLAEELGCTLAQLALAWCARNPRVSCVLMGARTLAQLEDNLGALAVLPELTPEVVERIESIVAAGEAAAVQAGKGA